MQPHDQPAATHPVQLPLPLSAQQIAWGCALASMGQFTPTSLRRPTSVTWPLAEQLGLTEIDWRPVFAVYIRLQLGDEILTRSRAMALYAVVSGLIDEEREPYLALAQAAGFHEPGQAGEGREP
jgi:hypothetical protein